MAVGQREKATQKRVIKLFVQDYLGDLITHIRLNKGENNA